LKLDRTARRILGALLEKRWTTPDAYPLSLNALVAACNQKSNRDPVLVLEGFEVEGCILSLREQGLIMLHESDWGRVPKYGERLVEQLHLDRPTAAVLAELLIRGPQTAGELLRRCSRMAHFDGQPQVEEILRELAGRLYVDLLPKRPRERYARWRHLLTSEGEESGEPVEEAETPVAAAPVAAATEPTPAPPSTAAAPEPAPAAVDTATALRAEVAELRAEVAALRERIETLEELV